MSQSSGANDATAALTRLAGVLGEDALFVLAGGARDAKEALDGLLHRRSDAYAASVQGLPYTRMTGDWRPWFVDMTRAMAPVSPPEWLPMMDVVRQKVTLEAGARGLRSLFSTRPSDKDVARVRRYGALAVRVLRAVLAADGALDDEEQTIVLAAIAAFGLPEPDRSALSIEPVVAPESLDVYGEIDQAVARAVVRGAWLAAALDTIDPREEQALRVVAHKLGVVGEDVEDARREALRRVDSRRQAGAAAVDGVRYVLRDRCPGRGVQLSALVGALTLPKRWREEALAPVAQGAPVTLARRHAGLDPGDRLAALGIAWAAAMVEDPTTARRAVLRARWERLSQDLGEDDPTPRLLVSGWMDEALAAVARSLE